MVTLPTLWQGWPTAIEGQFHYTEGNAVSRDDYKTFFAQDLAEAAAKLFSVEQDHWHFPG